METTRRDGSARALGTPAVAPGRGPRRRGWALAVPGEVITMDIGTVTHKPRRAATLALVAAVALLGAGAALAQSTIDPSKFANKSATVWQFLRDNASRRPGTACYSSSSNPSETFTCLQAALQATGLDEPLRGTDPVTLFAPTDAGFRTLAHLMGPGPFAVMMNDKAKLTTMLQGLMVEGRYSPADLKGRAVPATGKLTLKTLTGAELPVTFDRFTSSGSRVKVAVGKDTFQPAWTAYLSGVATMLRNGAVIPMDMVYLPPSLR